MTFKPFDPEQLVGPCPHPELSLTLTRLTQEDLDALYAIEQQAQSHPWSRRLFEDCLTSRQRCMVLKTGSTIVGYYVATVAAGSAELLNIATAPTWQQRGVARAALQHLLSTLADCADTLYLEVRESNHAARHLYQQLGFAEVGERPQYYPAANGRETAVIMAYPM